MNGALVIASHLPGEGHFRSERFRVAPIQCHREFDYWRGLWRLWPQPITLVNVEHDVDVSDEHVQALLDCPHPLCSWAYHCHWASTGLPRDVIAAGTGEHFSPGQRYLQGGEEWADWSAVGLVKIAPEGRFGELRREPWQRVELAVHAAVRPPWHMHWPEVNHWHW